jgi:cytosine/adenosine deaminase-related metal-dependent hydrolase
LKEKHLLSVHNVYATAQDWKIALEYTYKNNLALFAVTCPRSNMFINSKLPDYSQWPSAIPVCLGTDSLVSNTDLSVYNEMLFLLEKTNLPFPELLTWATLNGAKALHLDSVFGSFDVGKKPGVNLISQFDFKTMKPAAGSTVSRLV